MNRKHRILQIALVAAVMGTSSPVQAAPYQTMYRYDHYDDEGVLVGMDRDVCTSSGVVTHGQWVWGRPGSDVQAIEWMGCEGGQWVLLQ